MTIVIETMAGEHISKAAERLVEMSRATGRPVGTTFNGVDLVATPDESAADVRRYYDGECERQAKEWRESPGGKEAVQRDRDERNRIQAQCDAMVRGLTALDFADLAAVLDWLCRFQPASDRHGVNVPRGQIAAAFRDHGYHANVNTGDAYVAEDRENVARYIIGQALDGLDRMGAIHPVMTRFAEDWRAKFGR